MRDVETALIVLGIILSPALVGLGLRVLAWVLRNEPQDPIPAPPIKGPWLGIDVATGPDKTGYTIADYKKAIDEEDRTGREELARVRQELGLDAPEKEGDK